MVKKIFRVQFKIILRWRNYSASLLGYLKKRAETGENMRSWSISALSEIHQIMSREKQGRFNMWEKCFQTS